MVILVVNMEKNSEVELTLTGLVYGGDAIGRLADGRAVFVPFGLPGERVRLRLIEEKRGHARATLLEVLQPSVERIKPRCVHFGVCTGCAYQHLAYSDQLKAKQAIVREQFARLANLAEIPLAPMQPSPAEWNYRNAVHLLLNEGGHAGYRKMFSDDLLAISECHLPEPLLNDLWPRFEFEPGSGLTQVDLLAGSGDDPLVVMAGEEDNPPEFAVDIPLSVVYSAPAGEIVLSGEHFSLFELLGRVFRVSIASFFRENTAQAEAMAKHVLKILSEIQPADTVLEVYSGVGVFSAFLAEKAGRLVAVEQSAAACEDFAENLDEFDNAELYEGDAGQILPALKIRPAAVLVDPPREGLAKPVLDALVQMRAPRLVYVSCDPSTLARDAQRLVKAGYRLQLLTPFDVLPHTYQVDCVASFELPN